MNTHLNYLIKFTNGRLIALFALTILVSCVGPDKANEESNAPLSFVDPFIGTGAHGHTYPGATVPFGMVQLSPDNGISGWDWCSGYHYSDSIIVGFSHLHLSGTGIGDLQDVRMMPVSSEVDISKKAEARDELEYKSRYSHDEEIASPGYYSVVLKDQDIKVELTAGVRSGFQEYLFPSNRSRSVVLDLAYNVNWDAPTKSRIQMVNDTLVTGYRYSTGWAKEQRVYFALSFSEPFESYEVVDSTSSLAGSEFDGAQLKALLKFGSNSSISTLQVRSGISSASVDGALLSVKEIQDKTFTQVKQEAESLWEDELNKINISVQGEALKKTFHTAMYHASLAPVVYSDLKNEYKTPGGEVGLAQNYTRYDIFSLWDTYRAAHPLFTILEGERVNDMINSMLAHYDEYGLLPVWSLLGNETNTMTGYHAIPVITDAYFKGFRGYDVQKAYEAMKASAMQDIRGVEFYKKFGFIPSDLEVESVTKNLEYAYDDWCIAQVAKSLGETEDYEYFQKRAQSFNLLYDPSVGFMRGKLSSGAWRTPFDPKHSEHRVNTDYTEGNAWQHTWYVPHDVPALIDLMGGNDPFISKLDSLFSISSEITGENISVDISGLIGQYAHGNEPSHHVAYLYSYAGAPWKTQKIVREILTTQYNETPEGLCGNDDCGQMSAWYIFSAMGFYPVNPANGIYVIGSPLFEEVTINLSGNKKFKVVAKNNNAENIYIRSATLNGEPYDKPYITHDDIMNGGELFFEMSDQPNEMWGTEEIPETIFN